MKHALILLVLASTLTLAACRSSSDRSGVRDAADTSVEASLVQLDPHIVGSGSNRALEFTLQNTSERSVTCAFTIDWFDAHGGRVPLSSTAWLRVELEARASNPVRVAPMPVEARSWRLRFQSPER
jgi:uncharacterized protein YcfL